jgi:hypothetical protein
LAAVVVAASEPKLITADEKEGEKEEEPTGKWMNKKIPRKEEKNEKKNALSKDSVTPFG